MRRRLRPGSGVALPGGQNGVSATGNINTDYLAWSPRVSFAYQLDKKTVIRSGYGVFYFPQGNAGTNIRQFRQPPFDFVVNIPFSGNDVPVRKAADGFPIVTASPNLTQGPALFALKGVTPNFRNGQMQQFNFTVQRDEIRYALWPDPWTRPVYCQNDYRDIRKLNILELDGDFDLFNDGTLKLVKTPGHAARQRCISRSATLVASGDLGDTWGRAAY